MTRLEVVLNDGREKFGSYELAELISQLETLQRLDVKGLVKSWRLLESH